MNEKMVILPKKLTINLLYKIINKLNFVFKSKDKNIKNFFLNLDKIETVDIIGMLVLYKFIEFSIEKKCFLNPKMSLDPKSFNKHIKLFGFKELIDNYVYEIKNKTDKELESIKIEKTETFLIAPQILIRGNSKSKKIFDVKFNNALNSFYGLEFEHIIEAILICAVEISSNFYNHAIDDTKSLILARGTKSFIEIACADTANGIINSLKEIEKYNIFSDLTLLGKAFEQEVTSKPFSNHMGYGLWLIKEIVHRYDGILEVFTSNSNFSLKFGKVKINYSPFWQGTLVYLKLPITKNGIDIGDIIKEKRKQQQQYNIKINFLSHDTV